MHTCFLYCFPVLRKHKEAGALNGGSVAFLLLRQYRCSSFFQQVAEVNFKGWYKVKIGFSVNRQNDLGSCGKLSR